MEVGLGHRMGVWASRVIRGSGTVGVVGGLGLLVGS